MDAFDTQLKDRLPLACATLELFDYAFDEQLLVRIYEQHRGRCYTDCLSFPVLLSLLRDALLQHEGRAHRLFVELERDGLEPVDESNFYRKLSRMPQAVSRALLLECTKRLMSLLLVRQRLLPGCFDEFEVVVIDGKKIKNAAKKLKPTRGYSGSLLGAKGLVAMQLNSGLALAMNDSLDGETNDVPLVADLLPQVRVVIQKPILWLADRQFCDTRTMQHLLARSGDHFAVRVRQGLKFEAESSIERVNEQGREVIDEVGLFGSGKQTMRLRRITLVRPGDDNVILLSDLLDNRRFDALDLLKLYKQRWGIEQMFQQVTETFALEHLIGCHPQAILLQLALCLLMYNLIQMLKQYIALDGKVDLSIVSTYGLFYDVKRELLAWAYLAEQSWNRCSRGEQQMRQRLLELTSGSWDPVAYTKAMDKNPRKPKPPPKRLHGGHSSVQRLLEGKARIKT